MTTVVKPGVAGTEDRPFTIRAYAGADRPALEAMFDDFTPKRAAQGLPPGDGVLRSAWLDRVLARGHHLVAIIDGRLVGHGMIIPFGDGSAELANFVHQSVRNRGIGTALNHQLVALARDHGLERLWLCVEPANRAAIRSYEKAGFRARAVTGWAPELEMELELD